MLAPIFYTIVNYKLKHFYYMENNVIDSPRT